MLSTGGDSPQPRGRYFEPAQLAEIAWVAREYGKWPHEVALGVNDLPGAEIPLAHLKFDLDCTRALQKITVQEQEKAARRQGEGGG